jgi:hypothetical protein
MLDKTVDSSQKLNDLVQRLEDIYSKHLQTVIHVSHLWETLVVYIAVDGSQKLNVRLDS